MLEPNRPNRYQTATNAGAIAEANGSNDGADGGGMVGHALAYASCGLPVFPIWAPNPDGSCTCGDPDCERVGKHPHRLARHGFKDATTNPTIIRRWWRAEPDASIGLAVPPNRFVVDVDRRDGGLESLERLEAKHGKLPTTLTARTGDGGLHLIYDTGGRTVSVGKVDTGIDCKIGGKGYIVAAPSRHYLGGSYGWIDFETPIAVAPDCLLDIVAPIYSPRSAAPSPVPVVNHSAASSKRLAGGLKSVSRRLAPLTDGRWLALRSNAKWIGGLTSQSDTDLAVSALVGMAHNWPDFMKRHGGAVDVEKMIRGAIGAGAAQPLEDRRSYPLPVSTSPAMTAGPVDPNVIGQLMANVRAVLAEPDEDGKRWHHMRRDSVERMALAILARMADGRASMVSMADDALRERADVSPYTIRRRRADLAHLGILSIPGHILPGGRRVPTAYVLNYPRGGALCAAGGEEGRDKIEEKGSNTRIIHDAARYLEVATSPYGLGLKRRARMRGAGDGGADVPLERYGPTAPKVLAVLASYGADDLPPTTAELAEAALVGIDAADRALDRLAAEGRVTGVVVKRPGRGRPGKAWALTTDERAKTRPEYEAREAVGQRCLDRLKATREQRAERWRKAAALNPERVAETYHDLEKAERRQWRIDHSGELGDAKQCREAFAAAIDGTAAAVRFYRGYYDAPTPEPSAPSARRWMTDRLAALAAGDVRAPALEDLRRRLERTDAAPLVQPALVAA